MTKPILLSRALAPVFAVLCACLLAFVGPASAFSPALKAKGAGGENTPLHLSSTSAAPHTSTAGSGGASIVRTIVGLAIVIAVIWGLAWILRQVKSGREGGRDSNQSSGGLASVAALTLGSGRSVQLVRAGNDYVLLGSTEHGVAPIHRYTEEQALEAGLLPPDGAIPEERPERSRLAALAGQLLTGVGQGGRHGQRVLSEAVAHDEGAIPGAREYTARSPIAAGWGSHPPYSHPPDSHPPARPDPMRMPSPSTGLIERLRELTVRR
jgi:flagellar protein FliO/FliZ